METRTLIFKYVGTVAGLLESCAEITDEEECRALDTMDPVLPQME